MSGARSCQERVKINSTMYNLTHYIWPLLLSAFVNPSFQVHVMIGGTRWTFANYFGDVVSWVAGCSNLPPGECCIKPRGLIIDPGFVYFADLENLDIAFVWSDRRLSWWRTTDGCSGIPFRSQVGGPTWNYKWANRNPFLESQGEARAAGASYLRLPPKLPPDPTEVNWLGVEGIKGLVWGGGKWFASEPGQTHAGLVWKRQSGSPPASQISRNKSVLKGGTFYAVPPPRGRYIDWITINGTNYTSNVADDLKYRSEAGRVLNLNVTAALT
ncbi:MAG: hypothetical protein Q9182_003439 [Xanthomendoza sp. 2 TL-2023]